MTISISISVKLLLTFFLDILLFIFKDESNTIEFKKAPSKPGTCGVQPVRV